MMEEEREVVVLDGDADESQEDLDPDESASESARKKPRREEVRDLKTSWFIA